MTTIDLTLGERLRIFRERASLTVGEAADKLAVSRSTLQRWEHDQIAPRRPYLREIASTYGVDPELLTAAPKALAGPVAPRVGDELAGRESVPDNNRYSECHLDRDSYYLSTSLLPGGADSHSYQYYHRRCRRGTFSVLTRKTAKVHNPWFQAFVNESADQVTGPDSVRRHNLLPSNLYRSVTFRVPMISTQSPHRSRKHRGQQQRGAR